jgi:hypothetical protein
MTDLDEISKEIAEACYINQMRSDAAYSKTKEIRKILLKFKGSIIDQTATKIRDLERRLYIAEKAVADSKL